MAPRTFSLSGSARSALSNLDAYGSAFEGASNIDQSIEPHVLRGQGAGGDPQITPEPMPRRRAVPQGLLMILVAAFIVAGA